MRSTSIRTGNHPALPRLLIGVSLLVFAIATPVLTLNLVSRADESTAQRVPVPVFEQKALTGNLVRVEPDMLVVTDGDEELSVYVHPKTEVVRGVGLSLVTDNDLSRLQVNDTLALSTEVHDDGTLFARQITANGFITRDGVIEARGAGFIDVRPRPSPAEGSLTDESMRIWISPAARVEWLDSGGARSMGYVTDLLVGRRVIFQGFRADDGTLVATYLWPSRL